MEQFISMTNILKFSIEKFGIKSFVLILLAFNSFLCIAQTNTLGSGTWTTPALWSSGVPGITSVANVNHTMTLNSNISIAGGAYYKLNASVTEDGVGRSITLKGQNTSTLGTFEVLANSTFVGPLLVDNNGYLIVGPGATLTVGSTEFTNNSFVWIKSGGTLIVNGNLLNKVMSTNVKIDGELIVNGNVTNENNGSIIGTGNITASGTITNSGTVMGSTADCANSPCTFSHSSCTFTNTIGSVQTICSGTTPAQLTGATSATSPTYLWQSYTTTSGVWVDATGTNNTANYQPQSLTTATSYRRKVVSDGCSSTSTGINISVNANAAITSQPLSTNTCAGLNLTLSVAATGASITYQWQRNVSGNWTNLTNLAPFSNVTTSSLTITSLTTALNASQFRCLVSVPSCVPVSSNTAVIGVKSSGGWLGTSSEWSSTDNWCGGIPTSLSDISIDSLATFMPIVSSSVSCGNLTIGPKATLTLSNSSTLNLLGNFANSGTLKPNQGSVVLHGESLQTIAGANTFHNLTINNLSGVQIQSGLNNKSTVKGILTLTSGTLTTNSNLNLNLDSGSIDKSGTGSISGSLLTRRQFNNAGYHYVASPLAGATVAELNDNITINTGTTYNNLWRYNETVVSSNNMDGWNAMTSLTASLAPLAGYALYFWGTTTIDMNGTYNHSYAPSITLTNTVSSNPLADGWNLVGNPYPSTLDWSASGWTKTNLDNAIYFWNPSTNSYASFVNSAGTNGGTQYIPAMQGFYVHVTNPGSGTLGMTNDVRTSMVARNFREDGEEESSAISLKIASGNFSDETVLKISSNSSANFDNSYDAYKLMNSGKTPSFYSNLAGIDYSINTFPLDVEDKIIPLKLGVGFSGTYNLKSKELGFFDNGISVLLEDKLMKRVVDLRSNPQYTFSIAMGDTTSRFFIHITKEESAETITSKLVGNSNQEIAISQINNSLIIHGGGSLEKEAIDYIYLYNTNGQIRKQITNVKFEDGIYTMDIESSNPELQIVKVVVGKKVYVGKVLIK